MFTNEYKTIHNFVIISFYNNIVVKDRPQLSFLPPILLNQNFKLTENVQNKIFGRFLFIFNIFARSNYSCRFCTKIILRLLSILIFTDSVVDSSDSDDSIEIESSESSLY